MNLDTEFVGLFGFFSEMMFGISFDAECIQNSSMRWSIFANVRRPLRRPAHFDEVLSDFGWAPRGFAAIPTAAIDPPRGAASPAVPALIGSGSPSCCLLNVRDFLEFAQ